jgi:hypothetical protein
VIDYSLPSSQRRLWVIDPQRVAVLFHEFVSHGRGSTSDEDPDRAVRFGNEPESHRSSLGTFLTGDTYSGKHGHSLELVGLEPGVNDRALERRIVIHPPRREASFRAQSGGRGTRSRPRRSPWPCDLDRSKRQRGVRRGVWRASARGIPPERRARRGVVAVDVLVERDRAVRSRHGVV